MAETSRRTTSRGPESGGFAVRSRAGRRAKGLGQELRAARGPGTRSSLPASVSLSSLCTALVTSPRSWLAPLRPPLPGGRGILVPLWLRSAPSGFAWFGSGSMARSICPAGLAAAVFAPPCYPVCSSAGVLPSSSLCPPTPSMSPLMAPISPGSPI